MGKGTRVGKVVTGYLVAASLGLSATGAFAQSAHPPVEQDSGAAGSQESTPFNQVGCDPNVSAAMQSAATYAAQQQYYNGLGSFSQPTTFFGCLNGLFNNAQSLLNAFNGTGSLTSFFSTAMKLAMSSLMSYLSDKACAILGNIVQVPSIPGLGSSTTSAWAAGSGSVPGSSVTFLLGVPQSTNVPINPTYQFANNQSYNPSSPPVPQGSDSGADLNWALATGGLSIRAAAETNAGQSTPDGDPANQIFMPGTSVTPTSGPNAGVTTSSPGTTFPNTPAPPPVSGLADVQPGPPDAAGAYVPGAHYDAANDPSSGQGSGEMGINKSPLDTSVYYTGGGQHKVCVRAYNGTIPWRDFNPGDQISAQPEDGGIGIAGRFTIFPNADFGTRSVYVWLLTHNHYYGANHTIEEAIDKFAPPNENNTQQYLSSVVAAIPGGSPSTKIGQLNQAALTAFVNEVKHLEGTRAGQITCKNYP